MNIVTNKIFKLLKKLFSTVILSFKFVLRNQLKTKPFHRIHLLVYRADCWSPYLHNCSMPGLGLAGHCWLVSLSTPHWSQVGPPLSTAPLSPAQHATRWHDRSCSQPQHQSKIMQLLWVWKSKCHWLLICCKLHWEIYLRAASGCKQVFSNIANLISVLKFNYKTFN